jgi:hypothetical protein
MMLFSCLGGARIWRCIIQQSFDAEVSGDFGKIVRRSEEEEDFGTFLPQLRFNMEAIS